MPYKLTPYDRQVRAQLMREQRLGGSYKAMKKKEQEAAQAASLAKEQEKEDGNWFTGLLETVGDLGANLVTGLGKGLEGLYDFGASLVGGVGGWFSDDFEKGVQEHIAKDHVGEWFGNDWQAALDESWLNDSTVGGIIEGVAQGVGQLLPAVAATIATGGAAAPTLASTLASLGVTMASAAGTSTEQAFQEGADYGEGMLYGIASGAVEGVTEKLTGGLGGLFGDGVKIGSKAAKKVGAEVAEVGLKRVAKEAVGEGVEEMISEVANPALKTIYKGKDALREYGDAEFWAGVGEAGIIGAGTSVGYGGTVGHVMKTSGVYADARNVQQHIDEQKKLRSKAGLTQADKVQIEQNIKADQELLSERLQRLSENSRAKVFEKMPDFKLVFEESGKIRQEQMAALDANIAAAGDTTYNVNYRTSTLSTETVRQVLENGSTDGAEIKVYNGELDAEAQAALDDIQEMSGAVMERSGGAMGGFIVAENIPDGKSYIDVDSKVAVISVEDLKRGGASTAYARDIVADTYVGDMIHEWAHGIEDTNAGKVLGKTLTDKQELHELAIKDVLARGYMKEFFGENATLDTVTKRVKELIAKENAGKTLTATEQEALDTYRSEVKAFAAQRLLGNKTFVKKLITTEPTVAERVIGKIRELIENFKARKSADAKKALAELRQAERLYLQAISEVGGTIDAKGKIHIANREEYEEKSPAEGGVRRLRSGNTESAALSNDSIDALRAAFGGDITKEEAWQVIFMVLDEQAVFGDRRAVSDFVAKEPSLARNLVECIRTYLQSLEKNGQSAFEEDEMLRRTEGLLRTALEKDFVQSERGNIDESDEMRYNEYTEEQYESFGWVRANDVLTSGEWKDFTSKFADAVSGKVHTPITKGGEYMIAVSDIDDTLNYGIDNIIVYAKGSIESPQVSRVLEIDLDNETDLDQERRNIYEAERRGIQQKAGELRRLYFATDFRHWNNEQGKSTQRARNNSQLGTDRGAGGSGTAKTERGQVKFRRKGKKATLTVNGETLNSIGEPTYKPDVALQARWVWNFGPGRYHVENAIADAEAYYATIEEAMEAENENLIGEYAKQHGTTADFVKRRLDEDYEFLSKSREGKVRFSRKQTGEAVSISKEEMELLRANYTVDDMPTWAKGVYALDEVTAKDLPAEKMAELRWQIENISMIDADSKRLNANTDGAQEAAAIEAITGKMKAGAEKPKAEQKAPRQSAPRTRSSGDSVRISTGTLAKLKANYHGEKVFDKVKVAEALMDIEAVAQLKPSTFNRLVDQLWKGFNGRMGADGYQLQATVVWDHIHTTILTEAGDYLLDQEYRYKEPALMKMETQITDALQRIIREGRPSKAAQQQANLDRLQRQANHWRDEHTRVTERAKALPKLAHELQRLADLKKGRYVNAANYQGDTFNVAVNELARMNWRGALVSDTKIREHFAKLAKWYTKENPLYKGDGEGNTAFKQEIADALNALGNIQNGALTVEDLQTAEAVVKYFIHEIETHDTYYKDEKRLDATPKAKEYIEKVRRAKEIAAKCGIWSNLMRSKFARMVADPAMLMRQADGYLDGFFTEQYEALRQGTIDANVKELELSEEFEQFWGKHKAYGKRYNSATVTFDGKEMPLQEAISLYMTMKRAHAFAGLAGAGFDIEGKKATEEISAGFAEELQKQIQADMQALPPEEFLTLTKKRTAEIEQAALEKVVAAKRDALYNQFTAEDRALIEVMERAYEACREIKVKIDEILQGYSNVTGGYYYPIRRTGLAENVDAYTGFEGDRVSNLSMNKDTVKNAHKLLIEPAHVVLMRHLKATSLYHGLGVFTDNFNRLYNLNIGTNANNPITVRTALGESGNYAKEMIKYFKELKQDVEGISKKRSQEKWYNDAVGFIRSHYATYQLGANPKVWVTQLSSLIAATNILDADCLAKGLRVSGKDVDEYCRLAWLRNHESSAAMAQAVSEPKGAMRRVGGGILQKIRDVAMLPIGKVDRLVITRLFGACQVQIEKNGGAKVGTKENKIEAGKLMTRVILETQQNSLATERSAAMRSSDELLKGFTMFSADAMKVGARFVDAFGELSVLKTLRKEAKKAGNGAEAERLQKEIKRARKQCVRATVSLVGVALFNAALAYAFKWLYRRDEEENVGTLVADTFGNMLGGIPFVRDLYGFFQDGFEMDHFLISTVNDVLGTAAASFELVGDAMDGKEITKQDVMGTMRKISYAAGQLSGLPVRNVYNFGTGMLNRVSPETGYEVESLFFKQAYASDLQKALDAGDDEMVGTIAGLMIDEKIGIEDNAMRKALQELTAKGLSVLPRSVGDSVTVDGETVTLTAAQQKKLRKVYAIGQEAVADMVKLKQFGEADEKVQAAAIKFIYDVYWDLALEDALGLDLAEKNVLFAEAIDIEKLAIIIATARAIEADKDKSGKAIGGSKKRKVQTFVNSLRLSAAEKYMVMGYLGYSNANGEGAVKAHISKLNLSKSEKEKLLKYSGYGGK